MLRPVEQFAGARASPVPAARVEAIKAAARAFRAEMLGKAPARYYESFDLVRVPYPLKYALRDACTALTPFIHILNRLFIVQFDVADAHGSTTTKTLLVSPSDTVGNRATPFFKRLADSVAALGPTGENLLAPQLGTVESALAAAGLRPEQVDYITYDHLHTQDLRRWLGTGTTPAYFPNAKLLVMRAEWASAHGLTPQQAQWYCPDGLADVPEDRVIQLEGDTWLGDAVALLHTPGHTAGNHSIVVHAKDDRGGPGRLFVTSENGVCADAYAPHLSKIPGVRDYAAATGCEVILNGNTLESSVDQYLSMIEEKEVAGLASDATGGQPGFYNVMPSSELAPYWMFPGVRPTFSFGRVRFGAPVRTG